MTLLALLLALAQQPTQPIDNSQDRTVGKTEPGANTAQPDKSTSSNTSDKAESLSTTHSTELQGTPPAKQARNKKAKSKKPQARTNSQARAKPLPEAYAPPSTEKKDNSVESEAGQGKGRKQPKPLGEKSDQ